MMKTHHIVPRSHQSVDGRRRRRSHASFRHRLRHPRGRLSGRRGQGQTQARIRILQILHGSRDRVRLSGPRSARKDRELRLAHRQYRVPLFLAQQRVESVVGQRHVARQHVPRHSPDPFGHVPLVLPVPARVQQIPAHHERRRHVLDRRPPVDNANHFRHFRKQPHLLFVKAAADVSLLQVGDGRSANLGNLRVSAGHPLHHVAHCVLHLVNPPIPMRRKAYRATPLPGGRRTPPSRR